MDIKSFNMHSGRMVKEDGTTINIADALAGNAQPVTESKEKIEYYQMISGRFVKEDGTVVNIADEIANGNIGGAGGTSDYNALTNKPTLNGVEISGDKTSADYKISAEVTQVDHGTSNTTFTLPPNEIHTWGEITSLALTLGAEKPGMANVYVFSFESGDTATVLSLPESVKTDIVVEPNMIYECSIRGGLMSFDEWEVSE